ncbi:MAG: T9SS type A sorting domain-containing protein, partial [Crocinitomicaceae bacterium]|nr:T9SS type A sorting domain-containing protein [Crocinitomicaceae bacterium]
LLPNGWAYRVTENLELLILNTKGESVFVFENPNSVDASNEFSRKQNTIMEHEYNSETNILTVYTKVKADWLLDANRAFPVKVDPTVNVFPNNAFNWTGEIWSDGFQDQNSFRFGWNPSFGWHAGYIRFNASSIPSGITVNSATGFINILAGTGTNITTRNWALTNLSDPLTVSGLALYNSATTSHSATTEVCCLGWRSSLFAPSGRTYLENAIPNGFIPMAVYAMGTWTGVTNVTMANHTSVNRPYLIIDYDLIGAPPTCALIDSPLDNASGISTSGDLTWQAVAGADEYDVFFGTSSTPPLVATTTAISHPVSGLLNNTTYYWRIVPKNAGGAASGCDTWSFTTSDEAPLFHDFGGADQLAFNNSVILDHEPTFRISHPSTLDEVQIQISQDVTFSGVNVFDGNFSGSFNGENNFTTPITTQSINPNIFPEPFDNNILVNGATAPTNVWFAPNSNPQISWQSTGGNPYGRIGFESAWNNFWGNFVRLPAVDATGLDEITLSFDVWHSWFAAHPNDRARIYLWADGAFSVPISELLIDGQNELASFGVNGLGFNFSEVRTSAEVSVKFDLTGVSDKSEILIYIEPNCGYNNSNLFSFFIDNVSLDVLQQLQNGDTYYARSRGRIGSNWTDWTSTTHSFTYKDQSEKEWFQNMQPQFETDLLQGVTIKTPNDRVTLIDGENISGVVANPSFETVTDWNEISNFLSGYEASLSGGNGVGDMPTDGVQTILIRPIDPGSLGYFNGDFVGITQQVDLTDIDEITMDIAAWHFSPLFVTQQTGSFMQLRVIIGPAGSQNNNTGTVLGTFNNPSAPLGIESWNNQTFDVSAFSGNHVLKIISFVQIQTSTTNDEARFYVDNIRTAKSGSNEGTITSTPINLSSFQGASSWKELFWDQTLNNGEVKLSVEEFVSGSWLPISGLEEIQESTDGHHRFDISGAGVSNQIRLVADLERNGAPDLIHWGVTTEIEPTPLPVKLTDFMANCIDNHVLISWETETELNNDYFEVQLSRNGIDFVSVGKVEGMGNSFKKVNYELKLMQQYKEVVYLRLKQVDFDGQFEYFPIISVNCSSNSNDLVIFPNPNDGSGFYVQANDQINSIMVNSSFGQQVYFKNNFQKNNSQYVRFDNNLAPGAYVITISLDNEIVQRKLVVN